APPHLYTLSLHDALPIFCGDLEHLLFMAFGVAMCGIGMLTLTGDTISMDVFGPIADNANGIGEMGFNKTPEGTALHPGEPGYMRSEEHTSELQSPYDLVC